MAEWKVGGEVHPPAGRGRLRQRVKLIPHLAPPFESESEIFEIEGDTMRSTTSTRKCMLRIDATLPAVMRGTP